MKKKSYETSTTKRQKTDRNKSCSLNNSRSKVTYITRKGRPTIIVKRKVVTKFIDPMLHGTIPKEVHRTRTPKDLKNLDTRITKGV